MEKQNKYPDALIADLTGVFALKDSNAPGYLSGSNLTALFSGLGFADAYKFPNIGIVTPDSKGLSRTQYALKRLTDLNNTYRVPEALTALIESTKGIAEITNKVTEIFKHYNIPSPLPAVLPKETIQLEGLNAIARPKLGYEKSPSLQTAPPITEFSHEKSAVTTPSPKNIDPVFDTIPPDAKVAFFSYSWDDEDHKAWVLKLANDLAKYRIHVLLDQYLPGGYSLTHFMNKGLDIADRVVVIGTPKYKEKFVKSTTGGVAYEESIIHADLMRDIATTKIIPIIHSGTFDSSLPPLISRRIGFDFNDETKYLSLVSELVREIYNVPKHPRPTLGPVPVFGYEDLSPREQENLNLPESDFRKNQDRKWLNRLLGNFSFELMDQYISDTPLWVDERVFISIDMWNSIINSSAFRIYDPKLLRLITDFHKLWHEAEIVGLSYYTLEPNTNKVRFHGLAHDVFVSDDAEKAFHKLRELRLNMQPILRELATYIQDNFEIDIEETSHAFLKSL
ncbi:MAG: toll/interleukin-1 receptor domain-containing protein [Muribaculaceae bacterium]|nr:toll/interleukin-1 receptor domain-containing protein [Muribaculaceae bacterium]